MSTTILERTIGDLVAERPSRSRVFEAFGIDYCCGGKRTLVDASTTAGISVDDLVRELESQPVGSQDRDWRNATVAELIDHILVEHHDWLRANLPRISVLAEKVVRVHGGHAPVVVRIADVHSALRQEIEPHLEKEERMLFPAARHLEATGEVQLGCHAVDTLEGPMGVMEHEHVAVGAMLEELVELTDGFRPPDEACNTWRAFYDALAELDRNTRAHVHLENEVLHPRIRKLEASCRAS